MKFRSQMVAEIRHDLGSIACEHVFYGEGTNGVYMDLRMATAMASSMVGVVGMGPEKLDERMSRRAANIGEQLISVAEIPSGILEQGSWTGAVLGNRRSRRVVAQILGSAYIDDWRLMYVNKEAIDLAAEALIAQGELMGDEISGLLDSVGLRMPTEADPYPEDLPAVPEEREAPKVVSESA
jgi:ATP-dependent Zn protease